MDDPRFHDPASGPLGGPDAGIRSLKIAHVDMDAFFASIEEMVRPPLAEGPLAVGGGTGQPAWRCDDRELPGA